MFQIGDKIVYPMHGAGIIESIEEKEILGEKQLYYVMNLGNMQVMFPKDKDVDLGIRQVVSQDTIKDVFSIFQAEDEGDTLNHNQRNRIYMKKMKSGNIYEIAEVIRDLVSLSKKRALSAGDKSMLDNARQMFISELALVQDIDEEQAVDLLEQAIQN